MKKLAIIGAGHLGQQIVNLVKQDKQFEVKGYFDDFQPKGTLINELPVLGGLENIVADFESGIFDAILIAIGYKHMAFKEELYTRLKGKVVFAKFIHSSCIIDPSARIEEGCIIYPGCVIDQHVHVKENVLLNIGCCLAHDGVIGAHSFISPRVAVAGFVNIGKACFLGVNSTVIDNITIAEGVQTGGGTVVIKNIEQKGLYVGNPAKFIR